MLKSYNIFSRVDRLLLIIFFAYFMCACGDPPSSTTIDPKILSSIVAWFAAKYGWKFASSVVDRHRGFFIRRRAQFLAESDKTLLQENNYLTLKSRLEGELSEVEVYLNVKIGNTSVDDRDLFILEPEPPHLKLTEIVEESIIPTPLSLKYSGHDAANNTCINLYSTSQNPDPATVKQMIIQFRRLRKTRVLSIVWRAAALHSELWEKLDPYIPYSSLNDGKMDEILDRRLRIVENMYFEVNSNVTKPKIWEVAAKYNCWLDGYRGIFEYPSIPAKAIVTVTNPAIDLGVTSKTFETFLNGLVDKVEPRFYQIPPRLLPNWWHYNSIDELLEWNAAQGLSSFPEKPPGIRLSKGEEGFFRLGSSGGSGKGAYALVIRKISEQSGAITTTPAEVIELQFLASINWWDRAWLYTDHVMSALHLEALRFAKLRREQKDDTFNGLAEKFSLAFNDHFDTRAKEVDWPKPAPLDIVGDDILRGTNEHFENIFLSYPDLQVGDEIFFWNNFLYSVIKTGMDQPANVLVTDVASDPDTGGVNLREMKLQGFKTPELTCPAYQLWMQKKIQDVLVKLQNHVMTTVAERSEPGASPYLSLILSSISWETFRTWIPDIEKSMDEIIINWSPYPDNFVLWRTPSVSIPGAWWVRIDLERWDTAIGVTAKNVGEAVEKAVLAIPKSVAWRSEKELVTADLKTHAIKRIPTGKEFQPPPWELPSPYPDLDVIREKFNSIYFPLFEPAIQGGWTTYLQYRAENQTKRGYIMHPVKIDGNIVPRFFPNDLNKNFLRVLRPRIPVK